MLDKALYDVSLLFSKLRRVWLSNLFERRNDFRVKFFSRHLSREVEVLLRKEHESSPLRAHLRVEVWPRDVCAEDELLTLLIDEASLKVRYRFARFPFEHFPLVCTVRDCVILCCTGLVAQDRHLEIMTF